MRHTLFLVLIFLFIACSSSSKSSTVATGSSPSTRITPQATSTRNYPSEQFQNIVYEPTVKTVQLYPDDGTSLSQTQPAVMQLGTRSLVLHFDELVQDAENYAMRIQHCTWNWEPSRLNSLQYLDSYNEFLIRDFEFSQNTRTPYVHYQHRLPAVKIPGNYVLTVYDQNDTKRLLLSYRFMVYDTQAPVAAEWLFPAGNARQWGQQLDLKVNYSQLNDIVDPNSQLKVVIRQNQRWDNTVTNLTPSGDFMPRKTLEFQLFDGSNVFAGGNQFRFFDTQTIRARGANVQRVQVTDDMAYAEVVTDKPRADRAYGQRQDLNGEFVINNNEVTNGTITGDYVTTSFFLQMENPITSPVYLAGAFTNYEQDRSYQMDYDAVAGGYTLQLLLKQGFYNYIYSTLGDKKESLRLEGSFAETENDYEVFVYYKPRANPADLLVGYTRLRTLR